LELEAQKTTPVHRAAKKKRKKVDDIFLKSQEGALFRHLKRPGPATTTSGDGCIQAPEGPEPSSAAALCTDVRDEDEMDMVCCQHYCV
jgi:hypothetical protein